MKYVKIVTKLPHKEDLALIKELDKVECRSMHEHQLPVVWKKAEDFIVEDIHNNRFIDFTSCIFVANSGHGNVNIRNAMRRKLNVSLLHSYTYPTRIRLEYLKALTAFTGFGKGFLVSAGTEATEAAIKIMRLHGTKTKRKLIMSFQGAMHGKTYIAEQLKHFDGDVNWIYNHPYPKPYDHFTIPYEGAEKEIAGIIIESYRGWDAKMFSPFYIQELCKWAKENNILVCFDEIQAGFGRTGKLFCYEHYKVKPDLVCLGKGLGGGVPLSAVLGSKKLLDLPNDLSSTNSGNPLVCSAGLANIKYFKDHNLIKHTNDMGYIFENILLTFIKYKIIKEINAIGLVGAIIFNNKTIADQVCLKAFKNGLLTVNTGRESLKLGPPLTINKQGLIEGLEILENAIKEVDNEKYKA